MGSQNTKSTRQNINLVQLSLHMQHLSGEILPPRQKIRLYRYFIKRSNQSTHHKKVYRPSQLRFDNLLATDNNLICYKDKYDSILQSLLTHHASHLQTTPILHQKSPLQQRSPKSKNTTTFHHIRQFLSPL